VELLNQYAVALTILGLVIGAAVYLYGTVKKGRSDIIRQDNADLRASNQDKSNRIASLEATVVSQVDTIKNLREVATQTPDVKQLIKATTEQQNVSHKQHAEVVKQLASLAKEISKMTTKFADIAAAMTAETRRKGHD